MPFVPRIRTILVGAFLVAAGLPLAVFWAWPQTSFQTFQMDEVRNRQALLARNLAASMGAYHDDLVTALRSFAPLIADGRGEEVRTSLEKLHFTRICVVNPDTGAVTRSFLGEVKGCPDWYSEARRAMFLDLAGNAGVGVSPAAFAVNGPAELILATRTYDVLVVGAVSTQFFKDLRSAADAKGDGYTAIVDQTGHVLAHPVTQLQNTPTDVGYLAPVQQILAGNLGAVNFQADRDGAELVAGFAVVDGPGWGVFIPRPVTNLQRAAARIQQEGLMVLALALCLSAVAGLLIARFISNQVSGIQQTTRQMAGGDRSARVAETGRNTPRIRELNELGNSLNQMADDIDAAHESELLLREAAGQAAAAKAEFLENLSGEIRTPVVNMLSMTELVRDGDVSDRQSQQLAAAADQGRTLLGLLDDILDFSQIEAGQMHLKEDPVDLANITLAVVRLMTPAASRKGIEVFARVPPNAPLVFGDAGRMRQLLLNLVGNAIKFTTVGHVFVDLQVVPVDHGAASIQIEVTDTGIGISPDRLDAIFSAFDSSGTDQTTAGLGLAICQRITLAINGSLAVESELERGSVFRFIAQLPVASGAADETAPMSGAFSDLRVMVLAAFDTQRDVLTSYLEAFGFAAHQDASTDPAIRIMTGEAAKGDGIDVMIYDPAGFDFDVADLQRLMAPHSAGRPIRLVVLADHGEHPPGLSETAKQVDKPVAPMDLCAALLHSGTKDIEPIDQPLALPMVPEAERAEPRRSGPTHRFLKPTGTATESPVVTAPLDHPEQNADAAASVQLFTISSIHRDEGSVLPQESEAPNRQIVDVIEPMPQAIAEILEHPDMPDLPDLGTSRRTVVLVDADPESRSGITLILDQFDIATVVVNDGPSTVRAMIATPDVAAVLIDLKTMGEDALETAQRISEIKTDLCLENCMVIGLAESGRGAQERELRAAGYTHLLKKPVKKTVMRRLFGPETDAKSAIPAAKSA